MPFGYWWTVAVISWGVLCALTRWRRLGSLIRHLPDSLQASAPGWVLAPRPDDLGATTALITLSR